MTRLPTHQIATMSELREPQKVLDRANGQPVAILKNSALVGSLVPAEAVGNVDHRHATTDELQDYLANSRDRVQPILDYLKDK